MYHTWTTPAGEHSRLYLDISQQDHVLIAGATHSGKSVIINGIIHTILFNSPAKARFILIDPKRVELAAYSNLPHTITHAKGFNPDAWRDALQKAVDIMDARYCEMERKRQKMYCGSDVYVIIDEYATIAKAGGRDCYRLLLRLVSEGRAARVHCIIATQVPKADIIRTEIRENMTARVCLHCNTKTESRVLMDQPGCETLPQYGFGYYVKPGNSTLYKIPMVEQPELDRIVTHWTTTKPRRTFFKPAI